MKKLFVSALVACLMLTYTTTTYASQEEVTPINDDEMLPFPFDPYNDDEMLPFPFDPYNN